MIQRALWFSSSTTKSNRQNVLMSTDDLFHKINSGNKSLYIFDASWHMPAANRDGKAEFIQHRIPGNTYFFDIDRLADINTDLPHTFPNKDIFQNYINNDIQLVNNSEVVVYDSVGMFSAARCWYMFKYFGHPNVKMLDGGLTKWISENKPIVSGDEAHHFNDTNNNIFQASDHLDSSTSIVPLIDMDPNNTKSSSSDMNQFTILDARSSDRFYAKVSEPRAGIRSGHIPGSNNIPFNTLLKNPSDMDSFLEDEELLKLFHDAGIDLSNDSKPIVTTCGSGVTACVIIAAMEILGRTNKVRLFDDSWTGYGGSDFEVSIKNKKLIDKLFAKCDIRVGEMLKVTPVFGSDKLYCEEIDVGEEKPRQVVSGIAPYYTPEELVGKKVLVVCNIKKNKIRKVDSFGMILCAEDTESGIVEIVEPPSHVKNGEQIFLIGEFEKDITTANQMKKRKIFENVVTHLKSNDNCIATFDDIPLIVGNDKNNICMVKNVRNGWIK